MVALKDGAPQDTTMGLTPTGGLMMGTRSGDLDPGALFYLLRQEEPGPSVERVERIVNDAAGLSGASGISHDMEILLKAESKSTDAKEAVELFCYCARKFIGALFAVLNGLDTLVFTGGMGANSPVIRARICDGLGALGIDIDLSKNAQNESVINREGSPCRVRVLPTNENLVMAKHAADLLSKQVKA
jgi:acetate kinase